MLDLRISINASCTYLPKVPFCLACALREPTSQSMNKFRTASIFFFPFFLYLSAMRVHSRTPHRRNATHHQPREAVNQEEESGVEQMNSRWRRRIYRLLNLAEANASFVEGRNRKTGHCCPTVLLCDAIKCEMTFTCANSDKSLDVPHRILILIVRGEIINIARV